MAILHSRYALVQVGSGGSPQGSPHEDFNTIGTQTEFDLSLSAGRIDTSNKTTQNWGTSLADLREFQLSGGCFINWPDTNGWAVLRANALAGTDNSYRALVNDTPNHYEFIGQVQDFRITGANRNAISSSFTIGLSQGAPTYA